MLGVIKILAGQDFGVTDKPKDGQFVHGKLFLPKKGFSLTRETLLPSAIESLEVSSEESAKSIAGSIGWGLVGGALTGGIGLAAGLLAGGNHKKVLFVCNLKDGRKFLGQTDSGTYTKMSASIWS